MRVEVELPSEYPNWGLRDPNAAPGAAAAARGRDKARKLSRVGTRQFWRFQCKKNSKIGCSTHTITPEGTAADPHRNGRRGEERKQQGWEGVDRRLLGR